MKKQIKQEKSLIFFSLISNRNIIKIYQKLQTSIDIMEISSILEILQNAFGFQKNYTKTIINLIENDIDLDKFKYKHFIQIKMKFSLQGEITNEDNRKAASASLMFK